MKSKSIFALIIISCLQVVAGERLENKFDPSSPIEIDSISQKEASELFAAFKGSQKINWDWKGNGCQARTTEMARIAESYGWRSARIYAEGELRHHTSIPQYAPVINWGRHIAFVIYVKQVDSESLKVFDPALFEAPVSQAEWLNAISEPQTHEDMEAEIKNNGEPSPPSRIDRVYFGSRFQVYGFGLEGAKDKWDIQDLKNNDYLLCTMKKKFSIDECSKFMR